MEEEEIQPQDLIEVPDQSLCHEKELVFENSSHEEVKKKDDWMERVMRNGEMLQNAENKRRAEIQAELDYYLETKKLLLEKRDLLTNRSPITEARIRAVNKRIDGCKKQFLRVDELVERYIKRMENLANETIEALKNGTILGEATEKSQITKP